MKTLTFFLGLLVTCQLMLAPDARAQLSDGLVGLWRFEGDADDASLNGNNGTLLGGAAPTFSPDVPAAIGAGQSIQFGGGDARVEVPHDASLDITGAGAAMTITAWVKPDNSGWEGIVAKAPTSANANFPGNYELRLGNGNGGIDFGWEHTSGGSGLTFAPQVAAGVPSAAWSHVAVTAVAGGNLTFYLDGAEVNQQALAADFGTGVNTSPLYIGNRGDFPTGTTGYNGFIDEVAVWNRELTPAEIAEVASGSISLAPSIDLDNLEFSSAVTNGDFIATITATDAGNPGDSHNYALAAGAGDDDNGKFQVIGDELQAGAHDFLSDPDGTEYSVRIEATGAPSANVFSQSFLLTLNADSDSDNLPDAFEFAYTDPDDLNVLSGLGGADADADNLTDLEEFDLINSTFPGLDPTNPDSDADNLLDGDEIAGAGLRPPTDPTDADTDDDDLTDDVETNTGSYSNPGDTGSDPTVADTDADGTPDGEEVDLGFDPTDPLSKPPVQLLGLWQFEGNADDSSVNMNHGTLMGGTLPTYSPDVPAALGGGQSIQFAVGGHDQRVEVPHDSSLDITGAEAAITISAWVKPDNEGWEGILAKAPTSGNANWPGNYELRLGNGDGNIDFGWENDAGGLLFTPGIPAAVPAGAWSHVAITAAAGGDLIAYLDGDPVGAPQPVDANFGTGTNTSPLYIGNRGDFAAMVTNFNGLMDDVALFDGALSEAEIEAIMSGDFSAFGVGSAAGLRITDVAFNPDTDILDLTWTSRPGENFAVRFSFDAINWAADLNDSVDAAAAPAETTSAQFDLNLFGLQDEETLYFRVEKN